MKQALRSDAGRWTSIGLRSFHLLGAALLGASLFGAPLPAWWGGALMVATGLVLFVADQLAGRIDVRELAGAWVLAKLAGVVWMLLVPAHAAVLFVVLLLGSSVFSHAPRDLRHTPLLKGARAARRRRANPTHEA